MDNTLWASHLEQLCVSCHVSCQHDLNHQAPNKSKLFLCQRLQHIVVATLEDLEGQADVHVFVHADVIVPKCDICMSAYEEVIGHTCRQGMVCMLSHA